MELEGITFYHISYFITLASQTLKATNLAGTTSPPWKWGKLGWEWRENKCSLHHTNLESHGSQTPLPPPKDCREPESKGLVHFVHLGFLQTNTAPCAHHAHVTRGNGGMTPHSSIFKQGPLKKTCRLTCRRAPLSTPHSTSPFRSFCCC